MDIALASKQKTFHAILQSLLKLFPDSVYPELLAEKIIEFTILIKKYDENCENVATHIVEFPMRELSRIKSYWDLIVLYDVRPDEFYDFDNIVLEYSNRTNAISFDWDNIHFMDKIENENPEMNNSRRYLQLESHNKDVNFINFNFCNVFNGCKCPIVCLDLIKINFSGWTKIKFFPCEEISFQRCTNLSFSLENMEIKKLKIYNCTIDYLVPPPNLKVLYVSGTIQNWNDFQIPYSIEHLDLQDISFSFPVPWDFTKFKNLEFLIISMEKKIVNQDPIEILIPDCLKELIFRRVEHMPILNLEENPNVKIVYQFGAKMWEEPKIEIVVSESEDDSSEYYGKELLNDSESEES